VRNVPVQAIGGSNKLTLYFRVPADLQIVGLVLATGKEDRVVNTMSVTSPKEE
jgi:hypothetical protein